MYELIVINDKQVKFEVVDADIFTTSLDVAKVFNKNHKDILSKIDNFSDDVFNRLKISPIEYIDNRGRTQKAYNLNRDAYSFLVMGFTGREADKWKLDFIEAFNKLEHLYQNSKPQKVLSPMELMELQFQAHKELNQKVEATNDRIDLLESSSAFTASDCFRYQNAVKSKAHKLIIDNNLSEYDKPSIFSGIHGEIKRYYGVASYKDLPHYKLDDVLDRVEHLKLKQRVGA